MKRMFVLLVSVVCMVSGNEFVVPKPVKTKRLSCSQLKEAIVQDAAQLWQASADAVQSQAHLLSVHTQKAWVRTCACTLKAIAQVQHAVVTVISNMVEPEKRSVWARITRDQLTVLRDAVQQACAEVADQSTSLSGARTGAKQWQKRAQQLHDGMPE